LVLYIDKELQDPNETEVSVILRDKDGGRIALHNGEKRILQPVLEGDRWHWIYRLFSKYLFISCIETIGYRIAARGKPGFFKTATIVCGSQRKLKERVNTFVFFFGESNLSEV